MIKPVPSENVARLVVPREVHRRVRVLAALRGESIQETTAKALELGFRQLKQGEAAEAMAIVH